MPLYSLKGRLVLTPPAVLPTDADVNALVANYYGTLGAVGYAEPLQLHPADTALVLVDVQEHLTKRAIVSSLTAAGLYTESLEPVLDAMEHDLHGTVRNISAVLAKCREVGIRPVHVGIQALLPGAEDTGALHKAAGMLYPPGSRDAAFLPEVAPTEGEITLVKTCSGIHVGTHIDQLLRNLGVTKVVIAGFYTDQCISSSVRDLADIGYQVSLVEDAIGAMSPERHENAMQSIRKIYANSETTDSILARLDAVPRASAQSGARHRR